MKIRNEEGKWLVGRFSLLLMTMFMLVLSACSGNDSSTNSTQDGQDDSESTEVTYESDVAGIIESNCLTCHGEEEEFPMNNYDNLMDFVDGNHTGALMRRLDNGENTEDGEPGNMYTHLGETDEEREENLATIKEWIGNWTLKRGDEITEEELDSIKSVEK